jgi:hypothetical protein
MAQDANQPITVTRDTSLAIPNASVHDLKNDIRDTRGRITSTIELTTGKISTALSGGLGGNGRGSMASRIIDTGAVSLGLLRAVRDRMSAGAVRRVAIGATVSCAVVALILARQYFSRR